MTNRLTIKKVLELKKTWHDLSIGAQNEAWDLVIEQLIDTMRQKERLRSAVDFALD